MNIQRTSASRGLKVLLGLGLSNLAVCVIFPNCGLLGPVDVSVGDSKVLNQLSKGPGSSLDKAITTAIRRHSTPKPEWEWNELGLWKKTQSDPATYVPKGYASSQQDGPRGRWLVDERDGKRLFVPTSSHLGYSHQIWEAEARKITANETVSR
jgi:hypothetical protein